MSMPNMSYIAQFNATNYSDPFQGLLTYGSGLTNGYAGGALMIGLWLVAFFALSNGNRVNGGIAASLLTMMTSWLLFFYADFVSLNFCYMTVAVFIGFVFGKVFQD